MIKTLVQQRQIPCFLSLHQPRSSIWRMLDQVILMAPGGRICYNGLRDDVLPYFEKLGHVCPKETNPSEFLLDLVSIDTEDTYIAAKDEARIDRLVGAYNVHTIIEESNKENERRKDRRKQKETSSSITALLKEKKDSSSSSGTDPEEEGPTVPPTAVIKRMRKRKYKPLRRFGYLLRRSIRQNIRNHRVNLLRLIASIGNAYLFSSIFATVKGEGNGGFSAKSVADRTAMLTFGIINMSMMALTKTIDLFSKEKAVVKREQQRRQYSSLEYLLSKAIAELPLDAIFAGVFTGVLKSQTGLRIGYKELAGTMSLMTVAGASLGFAIGSLSPTGEFALSAGIPVMVILMTVGVINPSGVALDNPPPAIIQTLKRISPIAHAVKAVCLAEYRGMEFQRSKGKALAKELPKMGGLALVKNGDQVLEELGLGQDTYRGAMEHLAVLSAVNLLISWVGLHKQSGSNRSSREMTSAYWLQFQSEEEEDDDDFDEEED